MKRNLIWLILFLITGHNAHALNIQTFRPNAGPTGTVRLIGSQTLPSRNFSFGLFTNYPQGPLSFRDFTTGNSVRPIVHYAATNDLLVEVGLHDRITAGLDAPVSLIKHIPTTGGTDAGSFFRLGDLSIYTKFALLQGDSAPIGLAIVPYIEVPTGEVGHFTGDRGVNYGARATVDKRFGRFYAAINFGYHGRGRGETISMIGSTASLDINDEFTFGAGGAFDLVPDRLQLMGEFTGATSIKDFARNENASPMEATGALRAYFRDKRIAVTVGGGTGVGGGYGAPTYRLFSGLSLNFGEAADKRLASKGGAESKAIVLQSVHFETGSSLLDTDARHVLEQNLAELKKHPDTVFKIEGHADRRGSEEYNRALSIRRAEQVRGYLVSRGMDPNRLAVAGYGASAPVSPNDAPADWERNRRVMIHLLNSPER